MEMNFCRRCGTALLQVENHSYKCGNGHVIFANASPASCLWIINDKNEALLGIRAHKPGLGMFDAPGGFNDGAETLEKSLARELEEEVGLSPADYTPPQYLVSGIDTYEYKGETTNVLGCAFYAELIGAPTIRSQDDMASARFIPINDINPDTLYFNSVRLGFLELRSILNAKNRML